MKNKEFDEKNIDFSDGILLDHNKPVYEKILKGFSYGNKVLFEQATGTGKSYVALKFLKDHAQGKRVLFVSPSTVIKDYFLDTFHQQKKSNDFNLSLDTCLYHGLKRKFDKKYDIIIFDEAHRMGAKTWGPNAKKLMENNKDALVLGMSATLARADRVDVLEYFDGKDPVSRYSLVKALKDKVLPSPDYTISKIDFAEDKEEIDKNIQYFKEKRKDATEEEKKKIDEFLDKLSAAKKQIAECEDVKKIVKEELLSGYAKGKKYIVFCPAGNQINEEDGLVMSKMQGIIEKSVEWFDIDGKKPKVLSVYSGFSKKENRKAIEEFKKDDQDDVKLLFAIDMLNEGLHVGDVDGVIMLRQTGSRTIYLQQLGRALSAGEETHLRHPKILDLVANIDYVDIERLAGISKTKKKIKDDEYGDDNGDDYDDDIEKLFFKLKVENYQKFEFIKKLRDQIFRHKKMQSFEFEDFYARLLRYKQEFGDLLVPGAYRCKDGYKLGEKVVVARCGGLGSFKLSEEQKTRLVEIGFVFEVREKQWNEMYEKVVAFLNDNGRWPTGGKNVEEEERRLYVWLGSQKKRTKDDPHYELLGKLGFWDKTSRFENYERIWNESYSKVVQFVSANGRWPKDTGDEKVLFTWLQEQRRRQQEGKLKQGRYDSLSAINFWDKKTISQVNQDIWDQRFEMVEQFLKDNGRWPQGGSEEEGPMVAWLKEQKRNEKNGSLRKDRYEALEKLGLWVQPNKTEVSEMAWNEKYQKVVQFINKNGKIPGFAGDKDETDLRNWLNKQRARTRDGKLEKGRFDLLKEIGFLDEETCSLYEKMIKKIIDEDNSSK